MWSKNKSGAGFRVIRVDPRAEAAQDDTSPPPSLSPNHDQRTDLRKIIAEVLEKRWYLLQNGQGRVVTHDEFNEMPPRSRPKPQAVSQEKLEGILEKRVSKAPTLRDEIPGTSRTVIERLYDGVVAESLHDKYLNLLEVVMDILKMDDSQKERARDALTISIAEYRDNPESYLEMLKQASTRRCSRHRDRTEAEMSR